MSSLRPPAWLTCAQSYATEESKERDCLARVLLLLRAESRRVCRRCGVGERESLASEDRATKRAHERASLRKMTTGAELVLAPEQDRGRETAGRHRQRQEGERDGEGGGKGLISCWSCFPSEGGAVWRREPREKKEGREERVLWGGGEGRRDRKEVCGLDSGCFSLGG